MQFHLERQLRLHTDPEYSSLYSWAIAELDGRGQRVGRDQIPWVWTTWFVATGCVLSDGLELSEAAFDASEPPQKPKATHTRHIRMPLRSGSSLTQGDDETVFQMFGTSRAIQDISLEIHPEPDPARQPTAHAWGCLSYTSENDFRDETSDDCLVFYLSVSSAEFDRYARMIAQGHVSRVMVSVGSVDGFYSEWSPSIAAETIRVLTRGSEQHVELPAGIEFEPPRLGRVGKIGLTFTRSLNFE